MAAINQPLAGKASEQFSNIIANSGARALFSPRLMFLCLVFLQTGCTLRVASEPLAYEGFSGFAWKVLPVSGIFELSAVLLFALNLALTFLWRSKNRPVQSMPGAALVNISSPRNG